jgi:hypothetical protein
LGGAFGKSKGARIIRAIFKDDSITKQEHLAFVRDEGWPKWAKNKLPLGRNRRNRGQK